MARCKTIDTSPRFLAVDLERQLLPGTFEHAIHHLLEREIDLSALDARYRNDATGAPAYPPATLLMDADVRLDHCAEGWMNRLEGPGQLERCGFAA